MQHRNTELCYFVFFYCTVRIGGSEYNGANKSLNCSFGVVFTEFIEQASKGKVFI